MSKVAVTQNDDIEKGIEDALSHIAVEEVVKDKYVAVKPNETWASENDKTAVTQPDTLRAVLRHIKQFSPRKIVVTGGSGAAETSDVMNISGMMNVVKEEDVEFYDHNQGPFEEIDLEYEPKKDFQGPQESVKVSKRILEYESLIVVSNLKLHETATVTLSMKNIAMSFPAADYYGHPRANHRDRHHFFEDMHSFIVAMIRRFPIDLAVTVGHPAMLATGPIGGYPVETGLTIASRDGIAADAVGARLFGFNHQAVRFLWESKNIGLGETDTRRMEFPVMSMVEAIQAFTEKVYGKKLTFMHE